MEVAAEDKTVVAEVVADDDLEAAVAGAERSRQHKDLGQNNPAEAVESSRDLEERFHTLQTALRQVAERIAAVAVAADNIQSEEDC